MYPNTSIIHPEPPPEGFTFATASVSHFSRPFSGVFTEADLRLSDSFGRMRCDSHDGHRTKCQDRGSAQSNLAADILGVKGELAPIRRAQSQGLLPLDILPSLRRDSGYDLIIAGIKYDAKGVAVGSRFVSIGESVIQRKGCHFFLVTVFSSESHYTVFPLTCAEVLGWDLRNDRHSPYRSVSIASIARAFQTNGGIV